MMMEYAVEGEVYKHLAKQGRFSEKRSSRVSGVGSRFGRNGLVKTSLLIELVCWASCIRTGVSARA